MAHGNYYIIETKILFLTAIFKKKIETVASFLKYQTKFVRISLGRR